MSEGGVRASPDPRDLVEAHFAYEGAVRQRALAQDLVINLRKIAWAGGVDPDTIQDPLARNALAHSTAELASRKAAVQDRWRYLRTVREAAVDEIVDAWLHSGEDVRTRAAACMELQRLDDRELWQAWRTVREEAREEARQKARTSAAAAASRGAVPATRATSQQIAELRTRIKVSLEKLRDVNGAEPSFNEVADTLGMPRQTLRYDLENWDGLIDPDWHWKPADDILARKRTVHPLVRGRATRRHGA